MKKITILAAVVLFFMGSCPAWADSTVESFTKFGGFKGSGAYEGTVTSRLQGDRKSETSSIKFTGAIMSWLSGGGETGTITRLDKGLIWTLDPKKKTYREEPITPFRKEEARKQADEAREKPAVRVTKSEFSVKKTGASETINGFPCEEYLITWVLEFEDLETKARTRNTMTTNQWTTPETPSIRKLQAEEMAFTKAYLKKIGLELSGQEMKQFGLDMFSTMSGASKAEMEKQFKSFKKEMAKLKGYPIRTVVSWAVEGDQTPEKDSRQAQESRPAINPFGGLGGLLSSVTGAAADSAKDKVASGANAPFFSSSIEVKSIRTDAVPGDAFEVPAGFTKE
ncbi:MAG TPA: hypothetical protein PKM41_05240 [Deltaproteobacteria bacterium]|jgi:hypothetical protein|nr:hypothetical protein [Deltaproteobacteria bacterium]HOI06181.1 hypothetical protein [Deltaproteobacteria bacterium]